MRLPIYLICTALVLAIKADQNALDYDGSFVEPMNVADRDPLNNYLIPKVAKFKPEWGRLRNPEFYLINSDDVNSEADRMEPFRRNVRKSRYESYVDEGNMQPSLSIAAPIDVLRKAMHQRKMQRIVEMNRDLLNTL